MMADRGRHGFGLEDDSSMMARVDAMSEESSPERPSGARFVALGILVSRVFGLVRQVAIGRFFGVAAHADVWQTALRLPNAIQNLLGEQSLSAGFIPVYSRLLAEGRRDDAARFAGAAFALLAAAVGAAAVAGVVFARPLVAIGAAGFLRDAARVAAGEIDVDRFELTVRVVRVIFPMTAFLALGAWALGVLNSHRRFLLPYVAPVAWNVAIVTALCGAAAPAGLLFHPEDAGLAVLDRWLLAAAWGALLGGALQFLVQLPAVLRLMGGLRLTWRPLAVPGVREALRAFGPALLGRGVVQISMYVSVVLASFLHAGAPAALNFAVILINLPMHAFGTSVAAAELPEMSRLTPEELGPRLSERLGRALRQAGFVICPSVVGYLFFGYLVAGLLFRGGRFGPEGNVLVAVVLAGYALGMLASTASRLLQNTFFALRDTRTPARVAAWRLAVDAGLGVALMAWLDRYPVAGTSGDGDGLYFGAAGLAAAASVGAWFELALLRRRLRERIADLRLPARRLARLAALAAACALPSLLLWALLPPSLPVRAQALVALPLYPLLYLGFAWWRSSPELAMWLGGLGRRRGRPGTG
jgi:putative peptidoglycan lipid II flippase